VCRGRCGVSVRGCGHVVAVTVWSGLKHWRNAGLALVAGTYVRLCVVCYGVLYLCARHVTKGPLARHTIVEPCSLVDVFEFETLKWLSLCANGWKRHHVPGGLGNVLAEGVARPQGGQQGRLAPVLTANATWGGINALG
jgi:hypothetical protein